MTGDSLTAHRPGARTPEYSVLTWGQRAASCRPALIFLVGIRKPKVQSIKDVLRMPDKRNILVVTADALGPRMAGPAIRAFEMSKALSTVATVKLASTVHSSLQHSDFEIFDASVVGLHESEAWADVIVFQGHLLATHEWLKNSQKMIVADIYDPMHLEQLEQGKGQSWSDRVSLGLDVVSVLNEQILRADFMVCASDKQRDFWLGQLAGMGRVNPATYDQDASLRSLLDVVPFGLDAAPPVQKRHAIKGTVPGIGVDDKVILWG